MARYVGGRRLRAIVLAGACAAIPAVCWSAPNDSVPAAAAAAAAAAARTASDPALDTARAAFERLAEDERRSVQDSLIWTGDYAGVVTGAFGRRTYEAVLAYQKRRGRPPTGSLDPADMPALLATAAQARNAVRFASVRDDATGVSVGVPAALLSKRVPAPNGTRWQSPDGRVTLETKALPGGGAELREVFDRLTGADPSRKVTYKLSRPDWFVVSGETATGKFYTRYAVAGGQLRSFSLSYDKASAASFDKLVIAIANSFVADPGAAAETAAAPQIPVQTGMPVASLQGPATVVSAAFSGVALGGGRVLTTAAVAGCPAPQVAGAPARILRSDPGRDLALLVVPGDRHDGGLPLAARPPAIDADLVVAFAAQDGGRSTTIVASARADGRIFAALQAGSRGSAVLDRQGALAGIVGQPLTPPRAVAGLNTAVDYRMAGIADLVVVLEAATPLAANPTQTKRLGEIAASVAPRIVAVTCGGTASADRSAGGGDARR